MELDLNRLNLIQVNELDELVFYKMTYRFDEKDKKIMVADGTVQYKISDGRTGVILYLPIQKELTPERDSNSDAIEVVPAGIKLLNLDENKDTFDCIFIYGQDDIDEFCILGSISGPLTQMKNGNNNPKSKRVDDTTSDEQAANLQFNINHKRELLLPNYNVFEPYIKEFERVSLIPYKAQPVLQAVMAEEVKLNTVGSFVSLFTTEDPASLFRKNFKAALELALKQTFQPTTGLLKFIKLDNITNLKDKEEKNEEWLQRLSDTLNTCFIFMDPYPDVYGVFQVTNANTVYARDPQFYLFLLNGSDNRLNLITCHDVGIVPYDHIPYLVQKELEFGKEENKEEDKDKKETFARYVKLIRHFVGYGFTEAMFESLVSSSTKTETETETKKKVLATKVDIFTLLEKAIQRTFGIDNEDLSKFPNITKEKIIEFSIPRDSKQSQDLTSFWTEVQKKVIKPPSDSDLHSYNEQVEWIKNRSKTGRWADTQLRLLSLRLKLVFVIMKKEKTGAVCRHLLGQEEFTNLKNKETCLFVVSIQYRTPSGLKYSFCDEIDPIVTFDKLPEPCVDNIKKWLEKQPEKTTT